MDVPPGRENSPDWMRNFQIPETAPSSDSDPYALDEFTTDVTNRSAGQLDIEEEGSQSAGSLGSQREKATGRGREGRAGQSPTIVGGAAKGNDKQKEGPSKGAPADKNGSDRAGSKGSTGKGTPDGQGAARDFRGRQSGQSEKSSSAANRSGNKAGGISRMVSRGRRSSEAGLINLDSDEELPPLATQQSAANAEGAPNKASKSAGRADSRDRTARLHKKGAEGLVRNTGHMNGQKETVEFDPYELPDDAVLDTAKRLSMSPAARLGMRKSSSNLDGPEGAQQMQTTELADAGRTQSLGNETSYKEVKGKKDGRASEANGGMSTETVGETVTDEELQTGDGRKKEKRKAENEIDNGLPQRGTRKRPRKSYKEDSGSEKNETPNGAGDDDTEIAERKLKGKARVREASEELEAARKAAEAVHEKEDSGSQKRRRSGGPILDAAEKVVSPNKRGRSVDEVPTQATAVPTQEVGPERKGKPRAASTLPLVLADKVHRTKVLVECEGEGENALDLSGDVGAVGRFSVLKRPGGEGERMFLDLKGVMYEANIVPSTTFMVLNLGPTEAKVEAIINDFVQLREEANVFQTETTIEGTLDDFDFGEGANDERPGRAAEQEGTAAEGQEGAGKGKAPTKKGPRKREADAVAKPKRGGVAKKKPAKSGARTKSKPKAPAKPRKTNKVQPANAKKMKN